MLGLSDHARGVLLVAGAALCWSSGGILIRSAEAASGLAIVFWRSAVMALCVAIWLGLRYRREAIARVRALGLAGVVSAVLLTGAFVGYVLAIKVTTVANTLVIMSASPLIAALLARLALGERLRPPTVAAILIAFAGIALMFGHNLVRGDVFGDALALLVAVSFGSNIVLLRRLRQLDMVPAMMLGGILSAVLVAPFAQPLAVPLRDIGIIALMGCVQLALGLFLFTRGTPYLSAAEVGLLTTLEMVFAPIWVWLGVGEEPPAPALIGGAMVLAAVIGQAVISGRGAAIRFPAADR